MLAVNIPTEKAFFIGNPKPKKRIKMNIYRSYWNNFYYFAAKPMNQKDILYSDTCSQGELFNTVQKLNMSSK